MTRRMTMKGPAGGPASLSICLVGSVGKQTMAARLSARERALLAGRKMPGAKADFRAGRAAAHILLGEGVDVLRARDGRPVPSRNGRSLRGISLSIGHSGGVGMAGLVRDRHWLIGVDIEARTVLSSRLSRRVLTPREKRRVLRAPASARGRAALDHWVLKEAALKTTGDGVARLVSRPGAAEVMRLSQRGWGRVTLSGNRLAAARLIRARGLTMAVVLLRR